eukprot:m.103695 g.103695  ORF g.103695 m.103695 type:complete len:319 (+) comp15726_c0_seq1:503-1459(+)
MLIYQSRMTETINALVSSQFYKGRLRCSSRVPTADTEPRKQLTCIYGLRWLDCTLPPGKAETQGSFQDGTGFSYRNEAEVRTVVALLRRFAREGYFLPPALAAAAPAPVAPAPAPAIRILQRPQQQQQPHNQELCVSLCVSLTVAAVCVDGRLDSVREGGLQHRELRITRHCSAVFLTYFNFRNTRKQKSAAKKYSRRRRRRPLSWKEQQSSNQLAVVSATVAAAACHVCQHQHARAPRAHALCASQRLLVHRHGPHLVPRAHADSASHDQRPPLHARRRTPRQLQPHQLRLLPRPQQRNRPPVAQIARQLQQPQQHR